MTRVTDSRTMPLPPWMTDLTALDLLLSVAETGSVGRAAQVHGIPLPSDVLASLRLFAADSLFLLSSRGASSMF